MPYTYIIKCKDDTLYTGIAKDVKKRMKEQEDKSPKAKYTRSHPIAELCALWESDTMSDAAKLEWAVKKLERNRKLRLVQNPGALQDFFPQLECGNYKNLPVFDIFSTEDDK